MRDSTQSYLDQATYKQETKEGTDLVKLVNDSLGEYFRKKTAAATVSLKNIFCYSLCDQNMCSFELGR